MYLLFFALWVIFNGNITLEICLFGLVIAAVMFAFVCRFMDYSIQKEKALLKRCVGFVRYAVVLVKEIVAANFAVMRMILSEREELEPALVSFQSDLKTETITVSLEDSEYVVHCLDESLGEGVDSSVFVEMLSALEEE